MAVVKQKNSTVIKHHLHLEKCFCEACLISFFAQEKIQGDPSDLVDCTRRTDTELILIFDQQGEVSELPAGSPTKKDAP